MRVTVALVGEAETQNIAEGAWEKPWDERPRVDLEVDPQAALADVLERAARDFGIERPEWAASYSAAFPFVAFFTADDQVHASSSVDLVDDHGEIVWNIHDFAAVPLQQLLDSADRGVIKGDPRRIYFILQHPAGNGLVLDWETLVEGLRVAREVAEHVATIGGALAAVEGARRLVASRLNRLRELIRLKRSRWTQRNGWPHDLRRTVGDGPWRASELGSVLGCTPEQAQALLEAYGFAESDGLWRPAEDAVAIVLREILTEIDYAHWIRGESADSVLQERLEHLLIHGDRLPEVQVAADQDPSDVIEIEGLTYDGENITYHARLGARQISGQVAIYEVDSDDWQQLEQIARKVLVAELHKWAEEVPHE